MKYFFTSVFLCYSMYTHAQEIIQYAKYGIKDSLGKVVVEPIYDEVISLAKGGFIVKNNENESNKFGLINSEGKLVIPINYDYINETPNGSIVTTEKDSSFNYWYSLFDKQGNKLLKNKFRSIGNFQNGAASVQGENNKFGLINEKGKLLLPIKYSSVEYTYNSSLIIVSDYDNFEKTSAFYVDTLGKKLTNIVYEMVSFFEPNFIAKVRLNGKYGFLDKKMKQVIPIIYDEAELVYGKAIIAKLNNKYGLISMDGKEILPFIYRKISKEHSSLLHLIDETNKTGFYNIEHALLISPKYGMGFTRIDNFIGYSSTLLLQFNGMYGMINEMGQTLIPFECDTFYFPDIGCDPFGLGMPCFAISKNKKIAILNKQGKEITPFIYDLVSFGDKAVLVRLGKKWGCVDYTTGKELILPAYDRISCMSESNFSDQGYYVNNINLRFCLVMLGEKIDTLLSLEELKDRYPFQKTALLSEIFHNDSLKYEFLIYGKCAVYDIERGAEVTEMKYDEAWLDYVDGVLAVRTGKKWGLIDDQGKEITPLQFDEITKEDHTSSIKMMFKVKMGEREFYIDQKGHEIK